MRTNEKNQTVHHGISHTYGNHYQHLREQESTGFPFEMGLEFGLSLSDVHSLKKRLERS